MSVAELDATHDPALSSWVPGADDHPDFPVQNLPLGIFSRDGAAPRPGTAIGDHILDLRAIADLLPETVRWSLGQESLNNLLALQPRDRIALRQQLSVLLTGHRHEAALAAHLHPVDECRLLLPARIGDYTDFYVGINHATNIGRLFRPDTPLLPNYKWVPIAYHGRASSIRVSDEPVRRPNGQWRRANSDVPVFGPTDRLDIELEMGVWIAGTGTLGEPVAIADAPSRIAGLSLLNDWSARDIQAWEYQPLGPFLSKNFHTTISPWIVTSEALAPFRIAQAPRPEGDPKPLPHLWDEQDQASGALSITIDVSLTTARMHAENLAAVRLSRSDARAMYWTIAQMVAHHSSNGCDLRAGDLLGTGTISTADPGGLGSLIEMTQGGTRPVELPTGETRTFLADGDEITLSARAEAPGARSIGFGPCRALILAAPRNESSP